MILRVVYRSRGDFEIGIRIDYDLAQRYAAMRSAGAGGEAMHRAHAGAPTAVPGAAVAARGNDGPTERCDIQGREAARTACTGGRVQRKRCGDGGADAMRTR